MTTHLTSYDELERHSIRASWIRFGPANRVGSEKGRHMLVVSEPKFRRFWKSLGLGVSGLGSSGI